jgi:hypothetical protein
LAPQKHVGASILARATGDDVEFGVDGWLTTDD